MSEALELVVESAWLQLAELAPPTARTLYLTPDAKITRFMRPGSVEIGTFTRAIHLADFRNEVFGVYDLMRGR
jgi:hypothetical protein